MEAYSTKDLCAILTVHKKNLLLRARREHWESQPRKGRGGGYEWLVSSMPEETQRAIRMAEAEAAQASQEELAPTSFMPQVKSSRSALVPSSTGTFIADEDRRRLALTRASLVSEYRNWLKKHGNTKDSKENFILAYQGGAWPEIFAKVGKKSWKSIERWDCMWRKSGDVLSLVDTRGIAHKGRTMLCDQHKQLILGFALHINNPLVSFIYRQVKAQCLVQNIAVPSEATVRRFLQEFKEQHYDTWVMAREGEKALKDKVLYYLERDFTKIRVGDVLFADGKTLNFTIKNPSTGKDCRMTLILWYDAASNFPVGWEISLTENTDAIAAAFRRACMRLGKIPTLVYLDNGKAFKSKRLQGSKKGAVDSTPDNDNHLDLTLSINKGMFQDLGVSVKHAKAYNGREKTIERHFRTMQELENWLPSWVGNNIEAKPARMRRNEKLHRAHFDILGGRSLLLAEAHMAIAAFFDEYVHRPQRGFLKGRAPADLFVVGVGSGLSQDEMSRLNMWMLSSEIRTVDRGGTVRILGKRYYAPELFGKSHSVVVRYDVQRPESVLIYDANGHLLAEATVTQKVHPAAYYLGDEEEQRTLQDEVRILHSQEQYTTKNFKDFTKSLILPETEEKTARLAQSFTKPEAIEAQVVNVKAIPAVSNAEREAHEARLEAHRQVLASRPAYDIPSFFASFLEKYEFVYQIAEVQGLPLTEELAIFKTKYEQSEEYQEVARPRYEQQRRLLARMKEMEEAI